MAKEWEVEHIRPKRSYRWNARVVLPVRVREVYSWAPYIEDPSNTEQLHSMRISIKRLRYSMELFANCYGPEFEEILATLEDWQEHLGSVHDCDVVADTLAAYEAKLELRPEAASDCPGIAALMSRYRRRRNEQYEKFLKDWHVSEAGGFRDRVLKVIAGESTLLS